MNIKKGNKLWTRLSRWFWKQRIVSNKHPLTRWCLKSTTAVNYEMSRHLKSHPYMIHPFSIFRFHFRRSLLSTLFLFPQFSIKLLSTIIPWPTRMPNFRQKQSLFQQGRLGIIYVSVHLRGTSARSSVYHFSLRKSRQFAHDQRRAERGLLK